MTMCERKDGFGLCKPLLCACVLWVPQLPPSIPFPLGSRLVKLIQGYFVKANLRGAFCEAV